MIGEAQIQQKFDELKEYLKQHGEDDVFLLHKASLLLEIGEWGEAAEILRGLVKRMPESVDAWYLLGQSYLGRNNLERAFLAFARAARILDKESPDYHELVESVLQMEGMPEGGADFFNTLLFCERHTFIIVVPVQFQRIMVQRYQSMAIALSELGQEVIFVDSRQVSPSPSDNLREGELLQQMLQGKKQDGDITVYSLQPHERALDILLNYLGESFPKAVFFAAMPDSDKIYINLCGSHSVICDIADDNSDFESAFWTSEERYWHERMLARMSLAVTVSSATLFCREYLLEHISNTYLVPNGVDQEEISSEQEEEPDDMRHIPHPRIGYVGVVYQRFDRDLFYRLAEKNTDWSFVLVGPVVEDWIRTKYPNIYLLGGRPHQMLSKYYKSFDAALIPYRDDAKMSLSCDPVKLYEQVCCNLPSVTGFMPDTYLGKPLTWHGNTVETVQAQLEDILLWRPRLTELQRSNFLFENSWLVRCAKLIRIAEGRTAETDFPERTLEYLKSEFGRYRGDHLNLERVYALSHARDHFDVFEHCYTKTVSGNEISFDRDIWRLLPELKVYAETFQYIVECKKKPNSKVLLLVGYFGDDNFGDELLLDVLLEQLKKIINVYPVLAGFGPAGHTQRLHHVPAVCLADEEIVRRAVALSDIVLLGPGGLMDDRAGLDLQGKIFPMGIYAYLFPLMLAEAAQKPMLAVGVGVDTFTTERVKALVQDIFPKMHYIGVRDEYSRLCLENVGIKNTRVSPDLSFLYSGNRFMQNKEKAREKILGVNLRPAAKAAITEIVSAVNFFLQNGWEIHFIAAQGKVDEQLLKQCIHAIEKSGMPNVKRKVEIILPRSTEETLTALSEVSMVLAMRLHINIMAWQMNVPSLLLAYDTKVKSLAEILGLSTYCLSVNECKATEVAAKLSLLWKNREDLQRRVSKRVSSLREDAAREFEKVQSQLLIRV